MRFSTVLAMPVAFLAGLAIAQAQSVDLRGVYVGGNNITHENTNSLTAALKVPGVDGLLLNIGWGDIEPAQGAFVWTTLDPWLRLAMSEHKHITLSIGAGANTPPWLFTPAPHGPGAKGLAFSISRKGGNSGVCESEVIAAPWDPAFLAQWDAMLAALSAHLKSAGLYDAVTLLRLTGINRDTDELHLPAETPQSTGLSCVGDAIATWQQAGYRPSLLLHGWDGITSSFRRYFPEKSFSVAIIARTTTPFPPIGEDGAVLTGTIPNQSGPPLALASEKLPGHLVIQNNTLYADAPAQPATIQFAESLGTMIAFQTNEDLTSNTGKHASCTEPSSAGGATPCTPSSYMALLETGIAPAGQASGLRAQYIELFATDANSFPADIQQAHDELVGPSPCVADATTLCLDDEPGDARFEVKASFGTLQGGGSSGSGHAIALAPLGVTHGGLFWFFDATNPELLVKAVDGCSINRQHWLFFAAGTNVGFALTVRDTGTGVLKRYTNADQHAAAPVQDTAAFDCP